MEFKEYAQHILDALESLTDDEFDELILKAGIEKCPSEDEYFAISKTITFKSHLNNIYGCKKKYYKVNQEKRPFILNINKVAS